MGETKSSQKQVKAELDAKFKMAAPSREILEELAISAASEPSPDNTFQYAFCMCKSTEKTELRYAITILDGLVKEGYAHQMDCMYGAACALYLLGEYDQARVSQTQNWECMYYPTHDRF
jgi:mitochondrial fission 1 protein